MNELHMMMLVSSFGRFDEKEICSKTVGFFCVWDGKEERVNGRRT